MQFLSTTLELVSLDVVPYSLEGIMPCGLRGLQDGSQAGGDPIEDLSATFGLGLGVELGSGFEFSLGHFLAHLFINSCKTQEQAYNRRGERSRLMARRWIWTGWG
ncbi:hypothetical protein GOP47_0006568 [Adiantum capillus-veneris]|uniref:Uncharacterized protein n=1 Tax=Adiantum capillus-veneris TaxID=13818 RepID=A0A9D4V4N4_ADICA|nr:hypothetical protein GOP47_0006568 [Adiantum capillus-veneris]